MAKIKLLFVQLFNSIGGAQMVFRNLITSLPKSEYECYYLFLYREGLGKDEIRKNPCPVFYVDDIGDEHKGLAIASIARALGIDIIVTTLIRNPVRAQIKKYYKKRMVEVVHSPVGVQTIYHLGMIKQYDPNETFDTIVSISEETMVSAKRQLKNYRVNDFVCIHNGIDTEKYKKRYRPKDKFTVGNVARISKEKNINRFFKIAKLLPQYNFRWVGGVLPMYENYVKSYIDTKPSNVTITGYIQEGIEEEFNKLDMFVLTSDNEGMPLAVLEAMASGLPVISTKVGNLHKILDRDYFYERPEEAAMLIREYAENKQKRNRIGDENRKIICGQYDIISMMKQYDILFKRMVGR